MQNTPGVASSGETRNILSRFIDTREIIELIKDLVRCPSHEGIANQETATAERIRSFLEAERIEAWLDPVLEGRCNVIARLRGSGGGRSLLLTGHTDTVPPFGMESPFEIRIENDAMYGRGTVDMKGALACMAVSMAAIRRAGITLPGDLWFAGVIDEESSSRGMRALIDRGFTADAAVVGEPTGLRMCTCHKGVEWFELIFHGRAVHAARQEEGVNAIQKAARCIMEMEERLIPILNGRVHPLIGKSTLNYGFINGGTQPSTVAGECVLQIGRRWIPSERYEDVIEDFENLLAMMRAQDPDFKAEFHPMEEESEPASEFYGNTHHEPWKPPWMPRLY
jgi:acetylornithine deacetylase/succinyl-diaminopimelate desuccinylase